MNILEKISKHKLLIICGLLILLVCLEAISELMTRYIMGIHGYFPYYEALSLYYEYFGIIGVIIAFFDVFIGQYYGAIVMFSLLILIFYVIITSFIREEVNRLEKLIEALK